MVKIITGIISDKNDSAYLLLLRLVCTIKLSKKYIPKNTVNIGYQYKNSWKPLGLERSILYR